MPIQIAPRRMIHITPHVLNSLKANSTGNIQQMSLVVMLTVVGASTSFKTNRF